MARIRYGFGVSSVHGKIGNTIYAGSSFGPVIKTHKYRNPRATPAQREQRNIFSRCVSAWRTLTSNERLIWQNYSEFYNSFSTSTTPSRLNGYHVFMELNGNLLQVGSTIITAPVWSSVIFNPQYGALTISINQMYLQVLNIPDEDEEGTVIRCTPGLAPSVMTPQNKLVFIDYTNFEENVIHFKGGYLDKFGVMPALGTKVFIDFYFVNFLTGFKSYVYSNSKIVTS